MKIGVLIDRLNVGGVEKIAIEEVNALQKIGIDATLLVLRRKGVVKNPFPELLKNIKVVYVDDRIPRLLHASFAFPMFYFFSLFHITYPFIIPFAIKKNEFDYIVSHGTYTTFSAIGIKKIRRINFSSFIWDPIGYILTRVYSTQMFGIVSKLLGPIGKGLDQMIVQNADTILVGGNAHDEYFKSLKKNIKIISIPPSVHPVNKISKNKKSYVLIATAWKKGKNPEYLLEIFREIPTIHIKMAGIWLDNDYKKEFMRLLRENGMQKNIEILGRVSEVQIQKLYQEASIVLQTNDDRGFGMPALEAAGNGTTFIIPEGQGVCKLFTNKIDGFYTKEKDTKTIVNYLKLLLHDASRNQKMSTHALETVQKKYSWELHAQQLMEVAKKYVKK